jgi:hypothetical protein
VVEGAIQKLVANSGRHAQNIARTHSLCLTSRAEPAPLARSRRRTLWVESCP